MAPKAGPSSSKYSASRLASSSAATSAEVSTPTPGPAPEPAHKAASAVVKLYTFFHREGIAYTYNGRAAGRYYCKACLNHEMQAVRAAREQFRQGAHASMDVIRTISMGRIEFFVPNQDILRNHLQNDCTHLSREARAQFREINSIISEEKRTAYINPFDYGSLYEAVQFPKYADSKQDIQPGAASPARVFAAHEATLLERAEMRRVREIYNATARPNKSAPESRESTELPAAETPAYDSDDFEEAQRVGNFNIGNMKVKGQLDKSQMYDIEADAAEDELEMPADFPPSDLLKALQSHAGDLYAERGLMSTEYKPKSDRGESIPSMIQSLDASALVALGILAQELTKAQVLRPHHPQPLSDFYERKITKQKYHGLYGYYKQRDNELISSILENLPEGSTVGLASEPADKATVEVEDSDVDMQQD